ncbi:hypothetical protein TNCV_1053351 [Trichonephila clavipes]|nr:hypothetical protein TNCV_1053351 [Trichonephila clavipes]
MSSYAKAQKGQDSKSNREFQLSGTEKYGIISKGEKKRCVFYALQQWRMYPLEQHLMIRNNRFIFLLVQNHQEQDEALGLVGQ